MNDDPERTYRTGESWTEKPGDHHQVSKALDITGDAFHPEWNYTIKPRHR